MQSRLIREFGPGPFGTVRWDGHRYMRYGQAVLELLVEAAEGMGQADFAEDAVRLMIQEPHVFRKLVKACERPETKKLIGIYMRDELGMEGVALRNIIPWSEEDGGVGWPDSEVSIPLGPIRELLAERGIAPLVWNYDIVPDEAIPALQGGHPTARPGAVEKLTDALEGQGEPDPSEDRETDPVRPASVPAADRP